MGFEALVSVGRWRGFGGSTDFNGAGFEPFTWAAGIGASTTYAGVFSTSHVPTIHPILAAKQAMTIDHVTNGRFALNVVTGWHTAEIEMFGAPLLPHDERYEVAREWLHIIRQMWTAEEPFDFEGRYYKVEGAVCRPAPGAAPPSGDHERGRLGGRPALRRQGVRRRLRPAERARLRLAQEARRRLPRAGRRTSTGARSPSGATRTSSRATPSRTPRTTSRSYVHDHGDWDAVENLVQTFGVNSQSCPRGRARDEGALHRRVGRHPDRGHRGADRREPRDARACRVRRDPAPGPATSRT